MDFSSRGSSPLASVPPVTKNIIIINVILWLATFVFKGRGIDLNQFLGLHFWQATDFNLAQLVTYMFMHDTSSLWGGIIHIGFNMFNLWMFGRMLEQAWGSKRFLIYYVVCGLGAALVQEGMWQLTWASEPVLTNGTDTLSISQISSMVTPDQLASYTAMVQNGLITIGASGAVFGLLLAFGMTFPNLEMFIIPIPVPIKAKWLVIGYGLLELFFGVTGSMSGVAHYAHLGGMLFGLLLILYWRKKQFRNRWQY